MDISTWRYDDGSGMTKKSPVTKSITNEEVGKARQQTHNIELASAKGVVA